MRSISRPLTVVGLGLAALALPLVAPLAQCVSSPTGLIAWWTGDVDGGDVLATNGGTLVNGATAANAGIVDGAFAFDGSGAAVVVSGATGLDIGKDESFTIEAWVNIQPGALTSYGIIANKWESGVAGYQLGVLPSGQLSFTLRAVGESNQTVSEGDLDDGTWHHVAAIRNVISNTAGETIATSFLFIDGVQVRALPTTTGDLTNAADFVIGDSSIGGLPFNGLIDEMGVYDVSLAGLSLGSIYLAGADGRCKAGGVLSGQVLAQCPDPDTPLNGVAVDIYSSGDGTIVASTTTDETGSYSLTDLTAGEYSVTVVLPIGFETEVQDQIVTLSSGDVASADFSLNCTPDAGYARAAGFWKRQFGYALRGRSGPGVQYDEAELVAFLDLIDARFYSSAMNPVEVYTSPASGENRDKLLAARDLLALRGPRTVTDRARQSLLSVLLNVASNRTGLLDDASVDGASVTQAITFCDQILDDPDSSDFLARIIALFVSVGIRVPSGLIPLDTDEIAYREGMVAAAGTTLLPASPNPFVPRTTLGVALETEGRMDVRVYDAQGREIDVLATGVYRAGTHQLTWDATDARGTRVAPGVYFARLETPEGAMSQRLVVAR